MKFNQPKLAPGVPILVRDERTVQIGLDPSSALIVGSEVFAILRPLLDGQHDITQIIKSTRQHNIEESSILNLISLLSDAGLVTIDPNPILQGKSLEATSVQKLNLQREVEYNTNAMQRRTNTEISIYGAGRLGTTIGLLLASSGYPNIRVIDAKLVSESDCSPWGASRVDIGARRDQIALQIIERVTKGSCQRNNYLRFHPTNRVAVLVPDQIADAPWIDPLSADVFLSSDTPHMFAALATNECLISSMIVPGNTPCLRCLYQQQCDIDPAWPRITQQLMSQSCIDLAPTGLLMRSALFVLQQIDRWIDTEEIEFGHLNQIRKNETEVIQIPTAIHPICGCALDQVA